jgi:AcrR family transcriptional regulator
MGNLAERKSRCCSDEANLARREEILETATELFAEHGFSDAVTQTLAERLGVGKGTIYRHFASKRALFLAAADRVMRKVQEQVQANIAGIDDKLERIERAIATFLAFFAEHPQFVELLIQERAYFKDRKRPTYFEHRETNIQRWRHVYSELIAEGRVRNIPVEQITTVISNVLYGIMVTNFFNGQPKPSDVQAKEILDVVFLGILTEPERSRRMTGSLPETTGPHSETGTNTQISQTYVASNELFGGRKTHESTLVDATHESTLVGGRDSPGVGGCGGDGVPAGSVRTGPADSGRRV